MGARGCRATAGHNNFCADTNRGTGTNGSLRAPGRLLVARAGRPYLGDLRSGRDRSHPERPLHQRNSARCAWRSRVERSSPLVSVPPFASASKSLRPGRSYGLERHIELPARLAARLRDGHCPRLRIHLHRELAQRRIRRRGDARAANDRTVGGEDRAVARTLEAVVADLGVALLVRTDA